MLILARKALDKLLPYRGTVLHSRASDPRLVKAVVSTPLTNEGKVDYDRVPDYASIWVTVSDQTSPLAGRPILITKMPDGRFAVTGGSGFRHWEDKTGDEKKDQAVRARKHLTVTGGRPKKTAREQELEEARQEVEAHNAPIQAQATALRQEAGKAQREAQRRFEKATGVSGQMDRTELKKVQTQVAQYAQEQHGMGEKEARTFAQEVTRQMARGKRNLAQRIAARRTRAAVDMSRFEEPVSGGQEPTGEGAPPAGMGVVGQALQENAHEGVGAGLELSWDYGDVAQEVGAALKDAQEKGEELSPQEIQHLVAKAGEETFSQAAQQYDQHGADLTQWDEVPGLVAPPAAGEKKAEPPASAVNLEVAQPLDVQDTGAMQEAVKAFLQFQEASQTAAEVKKSLLPETVEITSPATLDQFRVNMGSPSPEDLEKLIATYERKVATGPAPDRFYAALAEHWNDQVAFAEGVGPHVTQGAATAVAGLLGRYLGSRVDVLRLMEKVGVEGATWALALELRKQFRGRQDEYDHIMDQMESQAAKGQEATETAALDLHERLKKEYGVVQESIASGEIGESRAVQMEADVLLRMRQNLGAALGSLQATAIMVEAMRKTGLTGATDSIVINFGDDKQAALARLDELKLGNRGELAYHPQMGWQIRTTSRAVRRYIYTQEQNDRRNGEWEKIKTSGRSTAGYEVPFWGSEWTDEEGEKHPYEWRPEQRNDIEWLRKAGSGVLTRVTGAGKTNTALGYYAHLLQENPRDFVGVIVVPKGRVAQWEAECRKFAPDLADRMTVIGEGQKVGDVRQSLEGMPRGRFVILSHDDAARNSEWLEALAPGAMTIDEPQEMLSRAAAKPKMSAGAKRIMRVKTDHRVALTATPAVRAATDVYDLVHWAFPGELGYRTRFARPYEGFGYGTNAQDEAVQAMLWREISPFVSGDRLSAPSFQVQRDTVEVKQTPHQRARQIELEAGAGQFIENYVAEHLESTPAKTREQYGARWKSVMSRKYRQQATALHEQRLRDVLRGEAQYHGDTARVQALVKRVTGGDDKGKHVIFVDSATQRQAITQALIESGTDRRAIQNIAGGTMTGGLKGGDIARRKGAFTEGDARFIIIDRTSASGHNLQAGSTLHVLGTPEDAATYLQAQGRVAREPRKGDVNIVTYRHADSPYDYSDWAALDTQTKILRATAPGLFVEPTQQAAKSWTFVEVARPIAGLPLYKALMRWDDPRPIVQVG